MQFFLHKFNKGRKTMYKFSIALILSAFFIFPAITQANVALDVPFAPVVEAETNLIQPISSHAVQADGKVLVGGSFSYINSRLSRNFARLNADGSFDNSRSRFGDE